MMVCCIQRCTSALASKGTVDASLRRTQQQPQITRSLTRTTVDCAHETTEKDQINRNCVYFKAKNYYMRMKIGKKHLCWTLYDQLLISNV